jgi:hypothetical protein
VSWLAEREGRGHYCSNRCKGLATGDVVELRLRSLTGADRAREHQARVDAQVVQLGLMTTAQLSAATHTSESIIRSAAVREIAGARLVVIAGTARLAWPSAASKIYPREWVRSQTFDRRRKQYLNPTVMVRQQKQLGRLTFTTEHDALIERITSRRRLFMGHRAGRPTTGAAPDHHHDWLTRFSEIRENYECHAFAGSPMPTRKKLCLEVALEDYVEHPARWPNYQPASLPREASDRIWKAIKPLLIAETEITS